jgi:glycerophosphoryl diester phosphodiesterase
MEIIGHRGAKGLKKENTLESFKIALRYGVDMIETDLRKHGKTLVLSHDPTVQTESYTSLSELLAIVKGRTPLNLEIKEESAVPLLVKELKNYEGKIIFSSFDFSTLQKAKKAFPNHEIAILEKWSGIRAVAKASLLKTDRIHINQAWLWSNFVRSLCAKGYRVYAYTVNSTERANELEDWGVKGIFTDYPDRFKAVQNYEKVTLKKEF